MSKVAAQRFELFRLRRQSRAHISPTEGRTLRLRVSDVKTKCPALANRRLERGTPV